MNRNSASHSRFPPLHPAVVHFPLALVTFSVGADVVGSLIDSGSLLGAAWWALAAASVGAGIAVISGFIDMNREQIGDAAHRYVHVHKKVGLVLFALIAALTVWRWMIYTSAAGQPGSGYLAAALVVLGLTLFQGWLGGELVYSHGVGVAPTGQGTTSAAKARRRLAWLPGVEGEDSDHPDSESNRNPPTNSGHGHH